MADAKTLKFLPRFFEQGRNVKSNLGTNWRSLMTLGSFCRQEPTADACLVEEFKNFMGRLNNRDTLANMRIAGGSNSST